jgi:hypothetical protein
MPRRIKSIEGLYKELSMRDYDYWYSQRWRDDNVGKYARMMLEQEKDLLLARDMVARERNKTHDDKDSPAAVDPSGDPA